MSDLKEERVDKPEAPKRFPGTTSFEDNELSAELFFGREEETIKLLHLILSESLSIIFSKSGNGKTSLLQASVFKKLRERSLIPVLVRLNKTGYSPQDLLKTELLAINSVTGHEATATNADGQDDIVSFLKGLEIWSPDDKLLTPVLVFDQFEEIFTLEHNASHRSQFFADLSDILKAKRNNELDVKIVIGIREDFLGYLEKLSADIPSVFVNRFRLEALKKENAREAIEKPARIELAGVEFASKPFHFTDEAVDELVGFLLSRPENDTWKMVDEIEPLQLQIICTELEERVIQKKIGAQNGVITVQASDLGGRDGLQNILGNFYDKQIQKIVKDFSLNHVELRAIKEVLEVSLIAAGRRIPMHYDAILRTRFMRKDALDQLIKNKLLKVDNHQDNMLVEISHDNLVPSILKSYAKRQEDENKEAELLAGENELIQKNKEKKKRRALILSIGMIAIIVCGFAIVIKILDSLKIAADIDKYKITTTLIKRSNPTLAFKLVNHAYNFYKNNNDFSRNYAEYNTQQYSYIVRRFKANSAIIYATFLKKENEYCVATSSTIYKWNIHGLLDATYTKDGTIIGAGKAGKHEYFIVKLKDTLLKRDTLGTVQVYDENNKLIGSYITQPDVKTSSVSPDGRHLIIGEYLYSTKLQRPLFRLKYWKELGGVKSSTFSADGNYIVSGHTNSFVLVQDTMNVTHKAIRHNKKSEKSIVNAVAITNDNKRVISACNLPYIRTWSIENMSATEDLNISANYLKEFPNRHTASINYASISKDNKYILTGSDDNNAILWDWQGNMISILKGHTDYVSYTGFLDNGEMITGDGNGYLMIWKMGPASKLEADHAIISFSPFEYKALGFEGKQYEFPQLYDTTTFVKKMTAVIDYTNTIPSTNQFPGDKNYYTGIMSSIDELIELNNSVVDDKRFLSVSTPNKKVFFTNQSNLLLLKKMGFRTTGKSLKAGAEVYETLGDYYQLHSRTVLVDTIDADEANYIYTSNDLVTRYFSDTVKNYPLAIKYTKTSLELMRAFNKKYPKNAVYSSDLSLTYGSIGWYMLFTREFENSAKFSQAALKTVNKDVFYSNLAMAYLFSKNYDKAWRIYREYKNKVYENEPARHFKDVFQEDFETMRTAGILTPKQPEIYAKANEIIKFLKD